MKDCCHSTNKDTKCVRKSDGKAFDLPRKYSKQYCLSKKNKGFTQRSSCAPYNDCNKKGGAKKYFLFNPDDPKHSYDVYANTNPSDTIPIKYTTVKDVKNTIKKLERLYRNKKYPHKRISQVGMILYVRLKILKDKKKTHFKLAKRYFDFLKKRTKFKTFKERVDFKFKI